MKIRVHYPCQDCRIVLRCEQDWSVDIEAAEVSKDGRQHTFEVDSARPYFYFKPVLLDGDEARWSRGSDYLALPQLRADREIWPFFMPDESCSVCEVHGLVDEATGSNYRYRVFRPPGYAENTLKSYPVLYLQDGQNVFFRDDGSGAGHGHDWRIPETLTRLAEMNAVDKVIAVGVYPDQRERDYTEPGLSAYSRFLATTLKPAIDRELRTLPAKQDTAIMGASLGGVAAFHTAWQWPEVFGKAACLSSTFGWRDDLVERVAREARRDVMVYLDSGWPHDNYEVTRDMRALLASRGWQEGSDLFYFAFPEGHHDEHSWALRCHIPIQLMFGRKPLTSPAPAGEAVARWPRGRRRQARGGGPKGGARS